MSGTLWVWVTSGGFRTSATRMEEVSPLRGSQKMSDLRQQNFSQEHSEFFLRVQSPVLAHFPALDNLAYVKKTVEIGID